MADEVICKRGWLKKQSSIVRNWNIKWFALKSSKLLCYAKDDEAKLLSSIELHSYRIHEVSHSGNGGGSNIRNEPPDRWLFELVPDSRTSSSTETLTFMAGSDQERQEWVTNIRRVLYRELGGGVFGQKLEETMAFNTTSVVPHVVEDCVEYLRQYGLRCEGILRLSGRTMLVKEIRRRYDEGCRPDLVKEDVDVHTVASVLKMYFRELPEPVIPFSNFHQYLDIATSFKFQSNNQENFRNLRQLLQKLPKHNHTLLHYLVTFLSEIDENSAENKMPMTNLGLIFGTHILRDENSSPELEMGIQHLTTQIVLALIQWHRDLFDGFHGSSEPSRLPDLISFENAATAAVDCNSRSSMSELAASHQTDQMTKGPARRSIISAPNFSSRDDSRPRLSSANDLLAVKSDEQRAVSTTQRQVTEFGSSRVEGAIAEKAVDGPCTGGDAPAQNACELTQLSSSSPPSSVSEDAGRGLSGRGVSQFASRESVCSVVVQASDPPLAPARRHKSLPKRADRPAVFLPPSPSGTPVDIAPQTFCSYIQSPTMTPCLDSMPTSVGDLQALVFTLKLLLREKEIELLEARNAITDLKASSEHAVAKVVELQAQLAEYVSKFGPLLGRS